MMSQYAEQLEKINKSLESQLRAADELAKAASSQLAILSSQSQYRRLIVTLEAYEKARGVK